MRNASKAGKRIKCGYFGVDRNNMHGHDNYFSEYLTRMKLYFPPSLRAWCLDTALPCFR